MNFLTLQDRFRAVVLACACAHPVAHHSPLPLSLPGAKVVENGSKPPETRPDLRARAVRWRCLWEPPRRGRLWEAGCCW